MIFNFNFINSSFIKKKTKELFTFTKTNLENNLLRTKKGKVYIHIHVYNSWSDGSSIGLINFKSGVMFFFSFLP